MLLSRFWYVVLALLLGAATFVLFLANSMYNRVGTKSMGERLSADSQVVSWYLKNDARERSAQLVKFALNRDIAKFLDQSSKAEAKVPFEYSLTQNYPNPFNPATSIQYSVASDQSPNHTILKIYNILGQEVRTLVDGGKEPGYYTVTWDGRDERGDDVSSGIYFYRLKAGEFVATKKMMMLKKY